MLVVLVLALALAPASFAKDKIPKDLPFEYRQFLEEVEVLMTKEERETFLAIEKDYQRDAFIRRFWESRDPEPDREGNRFKETFYLRRAEALAEYGDFRDDRARIYLLNDAPAQVIEGDCDMMLWPFEIWRYSYSEHTGRSFSVVFYQSNGGGPFRIWRPVEGYAELVSFKVSGDFYEILSRCTSLAELRSGQTELIFAFRLYEQQSPTGPSDAERSPDPFDPEWLATFAAYSTEVGEEVEPLEAEVSYEFAGTHRARVVVRGLVEVSPSGASQVELGGQRSHNFQLTGEVLRGEELFESFRYRFDLPVRESEEALPLVFERFLRPGEFRIVLKLEDLHGAAAFRDAQEIEVPRVAAVTEALEAAAAAAELAAETEAPVAEAASIELVAEATELASGMARFGAKVSGTGVSKVRFLLDDEPVLTKTRPPYSVELDLGDLPVTHRVRAVALAADGSELATDQVMVNPGEHALAVTVIEPRRGERYDGSVRARVEVQVPAGAKLDRLELFLDESRVATLYQPPFTQPVSLAGDGLAYLRAVAYLEDGNSAEDLVVFNAPDYLEDISVRFVELFATVVGRDGHPVHDLEREAFSVFEGGLEQQLVRFERRDDLPIYAGLMVDTSASMAEHLDTVRSAALGFFESTIEPKDRASLITFSDKPRLAAAFTNDFDTLTSALAGLSAERTTALWDSVMYGLYYFRGVRGQRALLVLSDGEDRRSEATFEEVLDFARTAGVTIYSIGLKSGRGGRSARQRMARLAEETGGRTYLLESVAELAGVYEQIRGDLRSRYFLAYQPSDTETPGFRAIEVRVGQPGTSVRTSSGYIW